jgi:hypothetical protein
MKLQVLNPVSRRMESKTASPSAPRLSDLEGKHIGLYWNLKPGGDAALKRAAELLKSRYPKMETKMYVGSIGAQNRFMTKEDVKRITAECSAVIGSTAD